MADIKLSYFDARGRAETSRMILAYAGVRYTDQRLTGDQFASVKARLPWGQLPTAKYNGTLLTQSVAIARFFANEYGLAGRDLFEAAQADEVVDAVNDIFNARISAIFESNDALKSEKMRTFLEETLPTGLGRMEQLLQSRGGQFMVGNRLTWADLHLFTFLEGCTKNNPELLESYPGLANLMERVAALPNISNWLAARPNTVL